jgi:hypothetical protein
MAQPDANNSEPEIARKPWSPVVRSIATVLWPSFLAASLATMVFFAFFDPAELSFAMTTPVEFSRMQGYGIGFLFFWFITSVSSAVSVFLVRTPYPSAKDDSQDEK